jgi:hypothetical protein
MFFFAVMQDISSVDIKILSNKNTHTPLPNVLTAETSS